jgi:hypothetical protein
MIEIYANDVLIGHVALAGVDDGMGVGSGSFLPTARYADVRPRITAAAEARHRNQHGEGVALEARTPAGEVIATGFVQIDDFADVDVDPEASIQFSDREQFLRVAGAGV